MKDGIVKGSAFCIASAVFYGMMPLAAKAAYADGASPFAAAGVRFFTSSVLLLFWLRILRHEAIRIRVNIIPNILFYSLCFSATTICLYNSYEYISSGLATTLHFTYPAFVIILSVLMFGLHPSRRESLALVMCLCGLALFLAPGEELNIAGMVLAVVSGLIYAAYIAVCGHRKDNPPADIMSLWISILCAIEILGFGAAVGRLTFPKTAPGWRALFGLAVLSTAAFVLFQFGLSLVGPVRTSLLSTLEPVTSILIGVTVLEERLTAKMVIGILLVLSCVVFLQLPGKKRE